MPPKFKIQTSLFTGNIENSPTISHNEEFEWSVSASSEVLHKIKILVNPDNKYKLMIYDVMESKFFSLSSVISAEYFPVFLHHNNLLIYLCEVLPNVTLCISLDKKVLQNMTGMMSSETKQFFASHALDFTDPCTQDPQEDPFVVLKTLLDSTNTAAQATATKKFLQSYYSRYRADAQFHNIKADKVRVLQLVENSGAWEFNFGDQFYDLCLPHADILDSDLKKAEAYNITPLKISFKSSLSKEELEHAVITAKTNVQVELDIKDMCSNVAAYELVAICYQILLGINFYIRGMNHHLPLIHPNLLEHFLSTVEDEILRKKYEYAILPYTFEHPKQPQPKGLLLYGPPGTGKSFTCKQLCTMLGMSVLNLNKSLDSSRFLGGLVGDTSKNILNEAIKSKCRPYLLHAMILDEVETIGAKRHSDQKQENNNADALNTLLTIISDVFQQYGYIMYLACTNAKQMLEEALIRAGRIESHIYVGPLSVQAKQKILLEFLEQNNTSYDANGIIQAIPNVSSVLNEDKLLQIKEWLHLPTLNFTIAQVSTVLQRVKLTIRAFQRKYKTSAQFPVLHIKEVLEDTCVRYIKESIEKNIRFNQLYKPFDYNNYCKPYEALYERYVINKFDKFIEEADADVIATGNFIIFQNRNNKGELKTILNHETSKYADVYTLPCSEDLNQVIFFAAKHIAAKMTLQSVTIVDRYFMDNVQEDIENVLKQLKEESSHQDGSMIIIKLDELVGYTANWSKNSVVKQTSTDTQNKESSNSRSNEKAISHTWGGSKQASESSKNEKSKAKTATVNSSTSDEVTKTDSVGTSNTTKRENGKTSKIHQNNTSSDSSSSHSVQFGRSVSDEDRILEERSRTFSREYNQSLEASNNATKTLENSESESYSVSDSIESSYAVNYEMTRKEVFHAIISFIDETKNLHIVKEKHKPIFVLVTKEKDLYSLILNTLQWGHKSLLQLQVFIEVNLKNANDKLQEFEKNHNVTKLRIEYSSDTIRKKGTGYLEKLSEPKYNVFKTRITTIALQMGSTAANVTECKELQQFPNLQTLIVEHSGTTSQLTFIQQIKPTLQPNDAVNVISKHVY